MVVPDVHPDSVEHVMPWNSNLKNDPFNTHKKNNKHGHFILFTSLRESKKSVSKRASQQLRCSRLQGPLSHGHHAADAEPQLSVSAALGNRAAILMLLQSPSVATPITS